MDSQYWKIELAKYYRTSQHIVATEVGVGGALADVYAVNGNDMSIETEIKLTKADLNSELIIAEVYWREKMNGQKDQLLLESLPEGHFHKSHKHRRYIFPEDYSGGFSIYYGDVYKTIPNYFYFAVPIELKDYALSKLNSSKYGLISLALSPIYPTITVEKRASLLKPDKISGIEMKTMLMRVSMENITLREKLYTIKKSPKQEKN